MPKNPRTLKKTDADKAWQKKQIPTHSQPKLEQKETFFIVCEGRTEELYFKSFPVKSAEVTAVPLGTNPPGIVQYARKKGAGYDHVWCVFDRDYNPDIVGKDAAFDNAVNAKNLKCAYSNDSFELWFVLHYKHIEQAELRTRYYEILSNLWEMNYEKEGKKETFARTIYKRLQTDDHASQKLAIERAQKLYQEHSGKAPHEQNPVTKVYELVTKLNEKLS